MAGIDKTYGTFEQYLEVRKFWLKSLDLQKQCLSKPIYLIPYHLHYCDKSGTDDDIKALKAVITADDICFWNTSYEQDLWLRKYCPLDFVQKSLIKKYPKNWVGHLFIDDVDFSKKPRLMQIDLKTGVEIYFFKGESPDIEPLEKIIYYGTSFLIEVYFEAVEMLKQHPPKSDRIIQICYDFYGLPVYHKTGEKEAEIHHEKTFTHFIDKPEMPEFYHSFNINDIDKYPDDEQIFLSTIDEAYDITQIKNCTRTYLKRYILSFLPKHYYNYLIK